jgi:hypothetical protein
MVKKDSEEDLITLTKAAELRGYKDVSAISHLVKRGRLRSVERYGKTLVYRSDVLAFEPDKGGRPLKKKGSKK